VTLVLGIGTSSPALSLALLQGDVVLKAEHRLIGRGHAEALVPAIAALLAGGLRPDAIVVDIGPGSFTGIRVGLAAARALGLAWNVPVSGVSAGVLVAAASFASVPALTAVTTLLDAGRGQVFVQAFDRTYEAGPLQTLRRDEIAVMPDAPLAGAGCRLAETGPDMAALAHLQPAQREAPPQAHYVRPPDAQLPL
jgi:tRNA threonylcarbamoyl adenosine modification protein YeaZ